MGYGRKINGNATLVSANLSAKQLRKNRIPDIPVQMHPGEFLIDLAERVRGDRTNGVIGSTCFATEKSRATRDLDHGGRPRRVGQPDALFQADGRAPRRRLGPRSTAATSSPPAPIFCVRAGHFPGSTPAYLAPSGWAEASRSGQAWYDQTPKFGLCGATDRVPTASLNSTRTCASASPRSPSSAPTPRGRRSRASRSKSSAPPLATELRRTEYHKVAEGYGGKGILVTDNDDIDDALEEAKRLSAEGTPVVINLHLAESDFRKGSISM